MTNEINDAEFIEQVANRLLDQDSYYEKMATPLKGAQDLKKEHKQFLENVLQMQEFRENMKLGWGVIVEELPQRLTSDDWKLFLDDFERLKKDEYLKAQHEVPGVGSFQSVFAISDKTMEHIYALGVDLIDLQEAKKAEAVFNILTFLNCLVPEYLIGSALALFWQEKYTAALQLLDLAKTLQPDKAIAFLYSALCKLHLKDLTMLPEDVDALDKIFQTSQEEKAQWADIYPFIKGSIPH